jgi:hypothetical protein
LGPNEEIQYVFDQITQVEWTSRYTYLTLACDTDEPTACRVSIHRIANFGWYDHPFTDGYMYAYDAINDAIAVVSSDATITINNRQQFDLAEELDGDILSVEWLPSLFYRE